MEKQYMANFALVFDGFLVFGNMFTTFFISYRISLLFECILQCLNSFLFNRVFLNSPLTSSKGIQNLAQHVRLFFTFSLKLNLFTKTTVLVRAPFLEVQGEQYIPESFSLVLLKILLSFQKAKKTPPWSLSFIFVDGFVYYVDELLPNNKKY